MVDYFLMGTQPKFFVVRFDTVDVSNFIDFKNAINKVKKEIYCNLLEEVAIDSDGRFVEFQVYGSPRDFKSFVESVELMKDLVLSSIIY